MSPTWPPRRLILSTAILLAGFASPVRAQTINVNGNPTQQGTNLLVNGGAESGISGWQVGQGAYNVRAADMPGGAGSFVFYGGTSAKTRIFQEFLLGSHTQTYTFDFSAYLGGRLNDADYASIGVAGWSTSMQAWIDLASPVDGPSALQRQGVTSLQARTVNGTITSDYTKVRAKLTMNNMGGNANNTAYADQMSFRLTAPQDLNATVTPEPISMTLLGTGLAGIAAARRRRRNRA